MRFMPNPGAREGSRNTAPGNPYLPDRRRTGRHERNPRSVQDGDQSVQGHGLRALRRNPTPIDPDVQVSEALQTRPGPDHRETRRLTLEPELAEDKRERSAILPKTEEDLLTTTPSIRRPASSS